MKRLPIAAVAFCVVGLAVAAPIPKTDMLLSFVDLQPKANQKLVDEVGGTGGRNTLASLPKGEQTFNGVKFNVGEKFVQLSSPLLKAKMPDKVEGIAVGRAASKLHFLHANRYGVGVPNIEIGTTIAEYRVKYADGKVETIALKFGENIQDWWYHKGLEKPPADGTLKVAWEGNNESANENGDGLRLYLLTWKNPRPEEKVTEIDFVRVDGSPAAPFCLAITAE